MPPQLTAGTCAKLGADPANLIVRSRASHLRTGADSHSSRSQQTSVPQTSAVRTGTSATPRIGCCAEGLGGDGLTCVRLTLTDSNGDGSPGCSCSRYARSTARPPHRPLGNCWSRSSSPGRGSKKQDASRRAASFSALSVLRLRGPNGRPQIAPMTPQLGRHDMHARVRLEHGSVSRLTLTLRGIRWRHVGCRVTQSGSTERRPNQQSMD